MATSISTHKVETVRMRSHLCLLLPDRLTRRVFDWDHSQARKEHVGQKYWCHTAGLWSRSSQKYTQGANIIFFGKQTRRVVKGWALETISTYVYIYLQSRCTTLQIDYSKLAGSQ